MQHVEDDAARAKMRADHGLRGRDAHAQDAVMRATQREHRARKARGDLRRDQYQGRAPRQAATLAEEHRLRRIHGVRTEAREYLEAPRQRMRTATERRAR